MKKKLESLHGEVKSFRKVAEDRLEEVFFTHPEYRKLKTAAAVIWMIDRINTLNYPFSTKDKTMVSVWKQVLSEKREEMIEAIEATEKPGPKKKTVYNRKAQAKGIAAESQGDPESPGKGREVGRELPDTLPPLEFDQALLKRMMKEKGISVTQAAEATGLSKGSIWRYRTRKDLKSRVITPGVRKLLKYLESQPIKEPKIKKTDKTAGQGIAAKSQSDDQGNPRLGVSRKLQAIPLASDKIPGKSNEEKLLWLVQTIYVMIRDADSTMAVMINNVFYGQWLN